MIRRLFFRASAFLSHKMGFFCASLTKIVNVHRIAVARINVMGTKMPFDLFRSNSFFFSLKSKIDVFMEIKKNYFNLKFPQHSDANLTFFHINLFIIKIPSQIFL